MMRDARFYFANLGADASRCMSAMREGDEERYQDSLERGYQTLDYLQHSERPEAYEEGLLMLRGVALAHEDPALRAGLERDLPALISPYVTQRSTL